MSFCDGIWDGEFIQTQLNREGIERLSEGLMQAEYTGRNFGVPYEFVAYSLPNWSFENAICLAVPHGILPRPNDADDALSVIAPYWESYVHFPVAQSVWHPYWNSDLPIFSKTIRLNAASTNMNRTRESTKGCFCSETFQKRRIKQPCREKFLMRNALRTKVRPYCVKTDWRSD